MTCASPVAAVRWTVATIAERRSSGAGVVLAVVGLSCGGPGSSGSGSLSGSEATSSTTTTLSSTGDATETGSASSVDETGTTSGTKLDVGPPDTDGPPPRGCGIVDGMDAIGDCDQEAPPDSFEPEVQWTFEGMDGETSALSVPLVINLTDDNGDGSIDLCDVPDIVATLYAGDDFFGSGHMYVLDGATGAVHFRIEHEVAPATHAATGDIDGDGLPELISFGSGRLVAFEHDGTLKWTGDTELPWGGGWAVALADVDADGDVEIAFGGHFADHEGHEIFTRLDGVAGIGLTTLADLDDDGSMEIIAGAKAWTASGDLYYEVPDLVSAHPQVADLDGDGLPEILLTMGFPFSPEGAMVLEHDGTPKPVALGCTYAWFPAAIHDMDGDGAVELAGASHTQYCVMDGDFSQLWAAPVMEDGFAGGTAFDFLGAGVAQAMYADNTQLYVFDEAGQPLMTAPRSSVTQTEFPVVADVDDDGSAEIVVISNTGYMNQTAPPVQVIRDADDRWIQARRIWNQHTYHVTNVREDGTIPTPEPKHWERLNTFRTQAQITADGGVCQPPPPAG
jgi:FG-GAP-like repeat